MSRACAGRRRHRPSAPCGRTPRAARRGRCRQAADGQRGFTLLELLVASALLALLAVIGWRGLESVLTARDRIVERSDDLRAMTVAFSQLDEDLRRSWPVERLKLLPYPMQALAFRTTSESVTVELVREGGAASDPSRIERVAYRLRDGRFERGFGSLLAVGSSYGGSGSIDAMGAGASIGARVPGGTSDVGSGGGLLLSNAPLVWQPLLADVAAVQYRAWVARRGWTNVAVIAAAQAALSLQTQQLQQAVQSGAGQSVDPALEAARDAARSTEAALRIAGVEVTLIRSNGDRYQRVFARED